MVVGLTNSGSINVQNIYPGESLNISYLSPYLKALGSNYSNGVNFAISGSTTLPRDALFVLHGQVQEFFFFKARSLELINQGLFAMYFLSNPNEVRRAELYVQLIVNEQTCCYTQARKLQSMQKRSKMLYIS